MFLYTLLKILKHLITDQRMVRKEGPVSFSLQSPINGLSPEVSWVVYITEVELFNFEFSCF
jgi:hypothetical protein